jgi:dienelactone hydrolase
MPSSNASQSRTIFQRIQQFFLPKIEAIKPSQRAWRGASIGLVLGMALVLALSIGMILSASGAVQTIMGVAVFLLVVALLAALITLLLSLLGKLPFLYRLGLTASLLFAVPLGLIGIVYLVGIVTTLVVLIVSFSLLGAGVYRRGLTGPPQGQSKLRSLFAVSGIVLGVTMLLITVGWLLSPGTPLERSAVEMAESSLRLANMLDPSQPGDYPVKSLCYGSADGRRIEPCMAEPEIETQPVDGSAFVAGWSGLRRSYWGFGPDTLPLNAKVWYPDGRGPFPLVVIVHGNALMEKPSHGGYAYLAELLASRGFVVASLDQNFLNLSFFSNAFILNSLEEENDARAWLTLEHLRLWHTWKDDPDSPFHGLIDLDQIALIGHSRGGEAVAVAAAFNEMRHYPSDARVPFDYGYSIRAVAAIAPVDGQYKPGGRSTSLQDIHYLVLQGAHDMDVVYFMGAKQYERVQFTNDNFYFKASVYIDGANHGQFNTAWGRKDFGEPIARFFNLRQLMPGEDQQQVARVYLSAFLDATLKDQHGYLPLFRDARTGSDWLPKGIYINQYADSNTLLISNYEEDVDAATTSLLEGSQEGRNLTIWQEKIIPPRYGSAENRGVFLGWMADQDQLSASYEIMLPDGLQIEKDDALVFSIAGTNEDPCPDKECREGREENYTSPDFYDLTVAVVDSSGESAQLILGDYAPLRPPLVTQLAKSPFKIVLPEAEIVMQYYEFSLETFRALNPAFDPGSLQSIRFIFDQTPEGVVVLDNIGIRQEPGYR